MINMSSCFILDTKKAFKLTQNKNTNVSSLVFILLQLYQKFSSVHSKTIWFLVIVNTSLTLSVDNKFKAWQLKTD